MRPFEPGDPGLVGGLWLSGRLGEGPLGVVFLGQQSDGTKVAVKLLHAHLTENPAVWESYQRAMEALTRVTVPHTARALSTGLVGARPFLMSEYVEGIPLPDITEPFSPAELDRLALCTATALAGLHAAGIAHGALRPSNVIMSAQGAVLTDYGLTLPPDPAAAMAADLPDWARLILATAGAHPLPPRLQTLTDSCLSPTPPSAPDLLHHLTTPTPTELPPPPATFGRPLPTPASAQPPHTPFPTNPTSFTDPTPNQTTSDPFPTNPASFTDPAPDQAAFTPFPSTPADFTPPTPNPPVFDSFSTDSTPPTPDQTTFSSAKPAVPTPAQTPSDPPSTPASFAEPVSDQAAFNSTPAPTPGQTTFDSFLTKPASFAEPAPEQAAFGPAASEPAAPASSETVFDSLPGGPTASAPEQTTFDSFLTKPASFAEPVQEQAAFGEAAGGPAAAASGETVFDSLPGGSAASGPGQGAFSPLPAGPAVPGSDQAAFGSAAAFASDQTAFDSFLTKPASFAAPVSDQTTSDSAPASASEQAAFGSATGGPATSASGETMFDSLSGGSAVAGVEQTMFDSLSGDSAVAGVGQGAVGSLSAEAAGLGREQGEGGSSSVEFVGDGQEQEASLGAAGGFVGPVWGQTVFDSPSGEPVGVEGAGPVGWAGETRQEELYGAVVGEGPGGEAAPPWAGEEGARGSKRVLLVVAASVTVALLLVGVFVVSRGGGGDELQPAAAKTGVVPTEIAPTETEAPTEQPVVSPSAPVKSQENGGSPAPTPKRTAPSPSKKAKPPKNLMVNGGFEKGFGAWQPRAVAFLGAKDAHSGNRAVLLQAGNGYDAAVEYVATGLKPNTIYVVTGWVTSNAGATFIGAKDFGPVSRYVSSASKKWTRLSVTFKTGAGTTARIYCWRETPGTGACDDIGLYQR